MALKFCPNCGAKIFQDSNFCSNCGESLLKYKEQIEENTNAEVPQVDPEIEEPKEIETEIPAVEEPQSSSIDVVLENEEIEVVAEKEELPEEVIVPLPNNEDCIIEETPMATEENEELSEDNSETDENESIESVQIDDEAQSAIEEPEEEVSEEAIETIDDTIVMTEVESIDDAIQLKEPVKEEYEVEEDSSEEEKTVKILGIPEWAFYTGLIVIGIVAILTLKLTNTAEVGQKEPVATEVENTDTVATDTAKAEAVNVEEATNNAVEAESQPVAPVQNNETSLPKQSGLDTDSAYHVIISTIGDKAKADELAKTCAYKGAYVISSDGKNRIAVFRSLKKADAQLYLDSVVKKDVPDAWLYSGTAK